MPRPAPAPVRQDPVVAELRHRVHQQLIEELGPILFDRRIGEDDLRRRVQEQLLAALAAERVPLSAADKAQLIQDVSDDILGYGPIDKLLREEEVTEVMVNGPDKVFVERNTAMLYLIPAAVVLAALVAATLGSVLRNEVIASLRRHKPSPAVSGSEVLLRLPEALMLARACIRPSTSPFSLSTTPPSASASTAASCWK
jgi:hypothetical protein